MIKKKNIIKVMITKKAEKQILFLMEKNKKKKNKGIKICIKKSGCAGFKYILTLVNKIKESDFQLKVKNINIFISHKWLNILNNTIIDFNKSGLNYSFTFKNKNHSSVCGCGESFNISNTDT